MKRGAWIAAALALASCGPVDSPPPTTGAAVDRLPGVHTRVDGVDVWIDSIPPVPHQLIQANVELVFEGPAATDPAQVMPAERVRAAAARARELGGDAALIRTLETARAASAFVYEYEVDVVSYTR
jgi:hypothetical protein